MCAGEPDTAEIDKDVGDSVYHEFVYVSGKKVRQFVPARPAWWRSLRTRKVGASLKFMPVEVSLEAEPADVGDDDRKLERLMRYLEESGRYYTVPDVVPGEWIMFDGRIGFTSLDTHSVRGAVLFCEAEPMTLTTPRIMLHGSAHHIVSSIGPTRAAAAEYSLLTAGSVAEIIEAASHARRSRMVGQLLDGAEHGQLYKYLTAYFHDVACTDEYRAFAPHLGGHAKVTAVLHPPDLPFSVILASPLYVRYERVEPEP